jgi:hypothetical protein
MTTRQAIRPTFRMSRKAAQRKPSRGQRSRTGALGPTSLDSIQRAARVKEMVAAVAGPRMPSAGKPSQPKVSTPVSGIWIAAVTTRA